MISGACGGFVGWLCRCLFKRWKNPLWGPHVLNTTKTIFPLDLLFKHQSHDTKFS